DVDEAPVLPTGYAGMILLALVPPLWRRVMDPRVLAHYGGDPHLANLDPRRAERILAAYQHGGPAGRPVRSLAGDEVSASIEQHAEVMQCPGCGYRYTAVTGDAREWFAPGTSWAKVTPDWCCPDCGVRDKVDFVPAQAHG
ncbi:MAG: rubredoxin, partial [Actinomycetales bacterium]